MKRMTQYTTTNDRLTGLYLHLLAFFAVNFGLFLLNVLALPFTLWFYFPLFMWGTALIIHFFALFIHHDEEWNEAALVEVIKNNGF